MQNTIIENILTDLYKDAQKDYFKIMRGAAKSMFQPIQPSDFKDAYLAISKEQGEDIAELIEANQCKNIIEFGTSFGISTLFLAKAAIKTGGHIITSEIISSKAKIAMENFKKAVVDDIIEVRIGDALQTLKGYDKPIDFLLLDGWKDLYLSLFKLLEPNFYEKSLIYVDNADMKTTKMFIKTIAQNAKYHLKEKFGGKAVLISVR